MANPKSLVGNRYTRLVVVSDSGQRSKDGSVKWLCLCDCGNKSLVISGNLKSGSSSSCGCLQKETASERAVRIFTKEKTKCCVDGCIENTSKGGNGYCGKHAQRVRRYGDANYVTPEDIRRVSSRESQLSRVVSVKSTTYRKYFGKHEHRVIAEDSIGRPLLSTEHVHHIDGDKHNNDPKNLQVMSREDHLRLHAMGNKYASA